MKALNGRSVLPQDALEELLALLDGLPPGDIVEIGANLCGTTVELATRAPERRVIAFDYFGMSEPGSMFHVNFGEVSAYAAQCPNIDLVQGPIEDTVPGFAAAPALLFIDCDEEVPAKAALEWFAPLVSGIIVIDDWNFGAIQTAVKATVPNWRPRLLPSGLAVLEKP